MQRLGCLDNKAGGIWKKSEREKGLDREREEDNIDGGRGE